MDSNSLEVLGDGDAQSATDSQTRDTRISEDSLVMFSHGYQPQPGAPWL